MVHSCWLPCILGAGLMASLWFLFPLAASAKLWVRTFSKGLFIKAEEATVDKENPASP